MQTAEPEAEPGARTPSRRRWVRPVATGVVLALLVGVTWWWTHPRVFDGPVGRWGTDPRPVAEATQHLGLRTLGPQTSETVTLTGYEVHFLDNSGAATGSLAVCTPRHPRSRVLHGMGLEDPDAICRELRPVRDGTRMRVGDVRRGGTYLILTIRPTRAGKVVVDGLDLGYRRSAAHLFQQGTQRVVHDDIVLELEGT